LQAKEQLDIPFTLVGERGVLKREKMLKRSKKWKT
jgi:hypothetical protein